MNAIQVQCGSCKRRFAAKPHLAGKRVKCPGCSVPLTIPDPSVITSIEATCSSCFAEFLAESSDIGQHVACPACGTLTKVGPGQAGESFSSADSIASGDPLFDDLPSQGASPFAAPSTQAATPLAKSTLAISSRSSGSSFLSGFWVTGVVAIVALLALVLCLVSGHVLIGVALLMIGLAVAGSSFVVPPPQRDRSSGKEEIVIASVAGGALLFIALIIAFVAKSMMGEGQPVNPVGPIAAGLFGMLVVAGAMMLFVFMVVRFGFSRAASAVYGGVGIVGPLVLILFAPAAVAGPGDKIAEGSGVGPVAPPVSRPGNTNTSPVKRPRPLPQTTGSGLGELESNPFAEPSGTSAGTGTSSTDEGETELADDDPFSESPFVPSATDDSSAGTSMADDSSSSESPFKESPFGGSSAGSSQPGTASSGTAKPSVSAATIQKLLNDIKATSVFDRRDALKKIAQIDPDNVTDEETRQTVVKRLNELALGDDHFTRAEAVKALGKWGDASSISVLLGLLNDSGSRGLHKDIFSALGRLKDPAAALVVAERLGDFFNRDEAEACLRQMGPVAEDALILVAQTPKKDTCLRAVKLLGDVGSEKCFEVLREAQRSRDVEIKEAGKFALRKIRLRQQTAGGDESDDEN